MAWLSLSIHHHYSALAFLVNQASDGGQQTRAGCKMQDHICTLRVPSASTMTVLGLPSPGTEAVVTSASSAGGRARLAAVAISLAVRCRGFSSDSDNDTWRGTHQLPSSTARPAAGLAARHHSLRHTDVRLRASLSTAASACGCDLANCALRPRPQPPCKDQPTLRHKYGMRQTAAAFVNRRERRQQIAFSSARCAALFYGLGLNLSCAGLSAQTEVA